MEEIKKIARKADCVFDQFELKMFRNLTQEGLKEVINSLLDALRELEHYIVTTPLLNETEIYCFKVVKPLIAGRAMFLHKLMIVERSYIATSNECHVSFYKSIQDEIKDFISNHQTLFLYYNTGSSAMDNIFFTRESQTYNMCWSQLSLDCYSIFFNSQSQVFAHFVCCELMNDFINWRLSELEEQKLCNVNNTSIQKPLVWTDSKMALTELVYALHSAKVINGGTVSLKEILEALTLVFASDIGEKECYRNYHSLRDRKKGRTTLLDNLKKSLLQKMDSDDRM